jgi:serine/threonine-protein kinase
MMAKRPEERYQTCRELLADLSRLREGLNALKSGGVVTQPVDISGPVPIVADEPEQPNGMAVSTGQVPAVRTGSALVVRSRRWLPWAVAASLLLAATGGAAVGWLRLHAEARSATGTQGVIEVPEPRPSLSEQERETSHKNALQLYLKPSGGNQEVKQQVRMGLDHATELAVFYLDRWRLGDADELFARLIAAGDKGPTEYQRLGRLGHAIVLGLQDKAAESNKLFVAIVGESRGDREKFLQTYALKQNPKMQLWVARALDHNSENAPAEFPKELKPLRDPPQGGAPKRPDKPPAKAP